MENVEKRSEVWLVRFRVVIVSRVCWGLVGIFFFSFFEFGYLKEFLVVRLVLGF